MSNDLRPKARLKTSKKWTPFPAEFLAQIKHVFQENFSKRLSEHRKGATFVAEGWIYPQELTLRLGFLEEGRLLQANFEVSTDYDSKEEKFIDHIYRCVDLAGSMLDDYLTSDGDVEMPREWVKVDFDGAKLWFQFSTVNSSLEAQANALLGDEGEALISEADEDFPDGEVPGSEAPAKPKKNKLH